MLKSASAVGCGFCRTGLADRSWRFEITPRLSRSSIALPIRFSAFLRTPLQDRVPSGSGMSRWPQERAAGRHCGCTSRDRRSARHRSAMPDRTGQKKLNPSSVAYAGRNNRSSLRRGDESLTVKDPRASYEAECAASAPDLIFRAGCAERLWLPRAAVRPESRPSSRGSTVHHLAVPVRKWVANVFSSTGRCRCCSFCCKVITVWPPLPGGGGEGQRRVISV